MRVICISGKAQSGKDSIAKIMDERLTKNGKSVLVIHYADLVKYICSSIFGWDGVKDDYGRSLLQRIGTDVVRKKNPNYWVDFVIEILTFFPNEWDVVLIPDCRFPNEIARLKEEGFDPIHVRVLRDSYDSTLTAEQQNHSSETALDNYGADYYIFNDKSMDCLRAYVYELLKRIGLSK